MLLLDAGGQCSVELVRISLIRNWNQQAVLTDSTRSGGGSPRVLCRMRLPANSPVVEREENLGEGEWERFVERLAGGCAKPAELRGSAGGFAISVTRESKSGLAVDGVFEGVEFRFGIATDVAKAAAEAERQTIRRT